MIDFDTDSQLSAVEQLLFIVKQFGLLLLELL